MDEAQATPADDETGETPAAAPPKTPEGATPAIPAPKKRRKSLLVLRAAIYVLLLCGGLVWASRLPINPHRDLAAVVDAAQSSQGEERRFHEGGAFLFFLPNGSYVLTLAVYPDREHFPESNFVVVAGDENGGVMRCTRMLPNPSGWSTQEVLEGDRARSYLDEVELDLGPLQKVFQRYYR